VQLFQDKKAKEEVKKQGKKWLLTVWGTLVSKILLNWKILENLFKKDSSHEF
jgi:hypothetical protein